MATYQELLALEPEALKAKYTELFGEEPVDLNKQQMASMVSKKLAEVGDNPAPKDSDKNANTTKNDSEDANTVTGQLKAENAALKQRIAELEASMGASLSGNGNGLVKLVKKDANGKVIDTQGLPEAAWRSLPAGQKAEWEVLKPAELQ